MGLNSRNQNSAFPDASRRIGAGSGLNRTLSRVVRGGSLRRNPGSSFSPLRPVSAQALVEFMLVSIPLLATMFGIFEFGLAFWDLQQLAQVTRDAAREVAECSNTCDSPPPGGVSTGDTRYYKDMRVLQAVVNRNPEQLNGTKLSLNQLNYVLIRRVSDTSNATGTDSFTINTSTGSSDISGQWQLYLPVFDPNTGQPPGSQTTWIPFTDYQSIDPNAWSKIPDLAAPANNFNTSYLSSPCIGIPPGNPPGTGDGTYTDSVKSANAATGENFTCTYSNTFPLDPAKNWARGRSVCQPADRFYVEVSYMHYWITPFLPVTGVTLSKPTTDNGFVTIKQRVYLKVEPKFFPVSGTTCPTGLG